MIFSGLAHTGKTPFSTVLIHGIVRDAQGRKMSKSLGNGIDPLEIIDEYGADALRYALITGNAPGNDLRLSDEKIEAGRNFINKIWNACRFVVMNQDETMDFAAVTPANYTLEDRWILSRLQSLKAEVATNLDNYDLGVAIAKIYSFLWEEYCDWYIEMAKPRLAEKNSLSRLVAQAVLNQVLVEAMRLLHPFMPFVTEAIHRCLLQPEESIMIAPWPRPDSRLEFPEAISQMALLMDAVRAIRNVRTSLNVPPSRKASIIVVSPDAGIRDLLAESQIFLSRLASVQDVRTQTDRTGIAPTAVTAIFTGGEIFIPLEDLIDLEREIERLEKEKANLEKEVARVSSKLNNAEFVARAPARIIAPSRRRSTATRRCCRMRTNAWRS